MIVQEEPTFLRRMREGFRQDDDKKEVERKRRRGSEEVIDEDEAPQVVIREKDKDVINADEARAYVAEKEGVKLDEAEKEIPKNGTASKAVKPKEESVSLGMKRTKKINAGPKGVVEDGQKGKEDSSLGKSRKKATSRKEKRLKLSFEDD
jgi:hypothetical protein